MIVKFDDLDLVSTKRRPIFVEGVEFEGIGYSSKVTHSTFKLALAGETQNRHIMFMSHESGLDNFKYNMHPPSSSGYVC